jgi:D-3-phosphoglycerate dehydrogenase
VLNGGEGRSATPELAWGLILALARKIPQAAAAMKQGGWQRHSGNVLRGKTLGLIGLGRIGQAMVPIARAFGMEVLAWSAHLDPQRAEAAGARWVSKEDLLTRSDFVSLHLVLGERTRHTLSGPDLARMKPTACIVNTARAGLIDEDAMIQALRDGRIAGAGLDVFEHEPLDEEHPLRRLDRAILTPHLGYAVDESLRAFYTGTVECLGAFLQGRPIQLATAA